jgi:outer membrane protein insertion porin family
MNKYFSSFILFLFAAVTSAQTFDPGRTFTYYPYDFVTPKDYVIKNILVEEANNKPIQKALVVIYSGLSIGQSIKIPGSELSKAVNNLWDLKYYSDIQLFCSKRANQAERSPFSGVK